MQQQPQNARPSGPWEATGFAQLENWDPAWARECQSMSTNPWTGKVLSRKFVELIAVAINVACTNLNHEGARRHIRAALEAGATLQQVKAICVKCAAIISTTLILAAPASAGDNKFVFVHQSDSPGNDYSTVENSSFEDCAQKCDAQSQCNAFTYNQLHSECFLKLSANRATTFYALAITGVKLSPSVQPTAGTSGSGASFVMLSQTDSPGNDYSQPKDLSVEECRSSCDSDDGCHAFTYNLARGECFLKHAANQWTNFYAWGITGIKLSPLRQSPTTTEENQVDAAKAGSSGVPSVPPVSTPEEQQQNTTPTREPDLR